MTGRHAAPEPEDERYAALGAYAEVATAEYLRAGWSLPDAVFLVVTGFRDGLLGAVVDGVLRGVHAAGSDGVWR